MWSEFTLAPGGSAGSGTAAVSRIPNSMEVWWIGADGSVQDSYWYDGGSWQQFALAPAGSAARGGGIAGVSRIPNSMEVWWIAPNGSVQGAYWYEGATWQRYELAPAGSAAPGGGGIAAVSRIPNSMEVWWVGADGSIQDAYWYEGSSWQRFTLAPAGSAAAASQIAAVSRVSNSMEVWWVGADGSVQDAYWYEGGNWQRFPLAPAGSAAVGAGITAVSRIPTSMEVWWIGADGSVQDAYWYDGGSWQRFALAPTGSTSTTGGVTAVSRIPNSMEVWWIGADGSVQDSYWYDSGNWQHFQLAAPGTAAVGGRLAAVSRIPNSMEVWFDGGDGSLQDAYYYGIPWQEFTLAPHGSAQGGIAAVSRVPNSIEVWWVGQDGSVQDSYWYEGSTWQQFALAPAGSAAAGGAIAAVSRIPTSMEVWWIGADGSVQGAYWYQGANWQRYELAPAGSASTTGGIAAVSRIPGSMEVWWVGADGSIQDAYWYDGGTWQRFTLAPAGSAALTSRIAAVSRVPNSMELWWIGADGSVQDNYWYDGGTWQQFALAPAGSASATGGIAAVSRIPTSMEVWWVGADGSVQDAYWYDGGTWQRFALAPAGSAAPTSRIAARSRIQSSMEVWWVGADGSVQDAYWYDGGTWHQFTLAPAGSASITGGVAALSRIPASLEVWWNGIDGSLQDAYWYDHAVTLDRIEVTQAIQDLNQGVPLVAGKKTVVRVYLSHALPPGATVWGTLSAQRAGGRPLTIRTSASVPLDPGRAGNFQAVRANAAFSLNFVLPPGLTQAGQLTVNLATLTDAVTAAAIGGNYQAPLTVNFEAGHPLRVRVLSVGYSQQVNPAPAPPTTFLPTDVDLNHLRSWLGRAYPVSDVIWSTGTITSNKAAPFGSGDVNAQVAAIRGQDMASGGDHRTHYYGMVSDGGFFMRGSASGIPSNPDPTTVASGPTGPNTWGWDNDGSYGDWYGGHELGHTFGRKHPGFCGESHDDPAYPYTAGQLASNDTSYCGFDVGDAGIGIAMAAYPGQQWHDVMTYCSTQWLSDYTYRGIRDRIAAEDALAPGAVPAGPAVPVAQPLRPALALRPIEIPLKPVPVPAGPVPPFAPSAGGRPDGRVPDSGLPDGRISDIAAAHTNGNMGGTTANLIHVVATVNLTKNTGTIEYVQPLPSGVQSPTGAGDAAVTVESVDGRQLGSFAVGVKLSSELDPGEDRTGLVDAILPVDPETKAVKLVIAGQTVDTWRAAATPPALKAAGSPVVEGSGVSMTWETHGTPEPEHTYSVQASTDGGKTWHTLAIGLATPSVNIDRSQFQQGQTVQLRVIATDGFTRSEVTSETFTA